MRALPLTAATLAGAALTLIPAHGQSFTGHYPIGVEGLKAGSLPPPGVYLRDYNLFYFADQINDPNGDAAPIDPDLFVYANAIRPIWITDWKVLGGSYGMDVLVPLIYTDVSFTGFSDSEFGLGDIFFEPVTLSWHWKQADLGLGYGFWAPTGDSDPLSPVKPGKGFWSHMFTLGGTWYTDAQKTWAISALARYELHVQSQDVDITPGSTLSLEWGVGKSLTKTIEVGAVGYLQKQVSDDDGVGASPYRDQVFGVGPEVNLFCPKLKAFFSLRYLYEFAAEDRPEGNTITLTFTKPL